MSSPLPNPERPSPQNLAEVFSLRVQASLFVLLLAFLGWIGWRTSAPPSEPPAVMAGIGKVDLNRADRTELQLLPGIGPELAGRIAAHRDQHGPFEGLGDLRKVSGVGPATLERLRPRVMLSWPKDEEPNAAVHPSVVTIAPAAWSAKSSDSAAILDPNTATLAELQTLPGIGPKLAQRIVEKREQKAFADVNDLRKVPGIGPKTLEKIKPRLAIAGERVQ